MNARRLWHAQQVVGVLNAFFMILNLSDGALLSASVSGACMLWTASFGVERKKKK